MNEQIKYRAWDKVNRTMIIPGPVTPFWVDGYDGYAFYLCKSGYTPGGMYAEQRNGLILLKYTTRNDVHGEQIFQGDLLVDTTESGYSRRVQEVKWCDDALTWKVGGRYLADLKDCLEKVGNIYENPELAPK